MNHRTTRVTPALLYFILFGSIYLLTGCYYDVESELYPVGLACDSVAISYSADVRPILISRCLNCHDAGTSSGSVVMETYTQVKAQADNGQLTCTINHLNGCANMPANSPQLPACQLQAINVWIEEGALDN